MTTANPTVEAEHSPSNPEVALNPIELAARVPTKKQGAAAHTTPGLYDATVRV